MSGRQPEGWELTALRFDHDIRNPCSSYVSVQSPHEENGKWGSDWTIGPGSRTGTYRIKHCGHVFGKQPPGWELTAHRSGVKEDVRNAVSSWASVHSVDVGGGKWGNDWLIEPGSRTGTYRIKTCGLSEAGQLAGWELTAHRNGDEDMRNQYSTRATVHSAVDGGIWGSDWELKKIG